MLTITRTKFNFIKIKEVYFGEDISRIEKSGSDIVMCIQCNSTPHSTPVKTLLIDLTKSQADIFSELGKNNRYKIKRAQNRDDVHCTFLSSPAVDDINEFCNFYNSFARSKQIPGSNSKKLLALREKNALVITKCLDGKQDQLCGHAYIVDEKRARLLYSASHYRNYDHSNYKNMLGRANRYLHWQDIIYFKNHNFAWYDFGGLNLSPHNENNIDKFKKSFGGSEVLEYNMLIPNSWIGKIALFYIKTNSLLPNYGKES